MTVWLFLIVINSTPLATFEDWYTDHARHSYSSILFTRVGFSIFSTPLGRLASFDSSCFKFVTWPQMPHLYPLGSVFLFLPFGLLLLNGAEPIPIFKIEICFFVFFAHICLYLFVKIFLGKTGNLPLKLLAIYPLYIALIVYSANGMFDSVALFFSLIGVIMYQKGKYDYFILFLAISISFKYQAAIFLLPLLLMGSIKIIQEKKISEIIRRKVIIISIFLLLLSAFTGYQSAPFLFDTRPEFVMNGLNAFSSHSQLSWASQSFAVIMTLILTLIYTFFLIGKNRFLSLSSLFLLLPSFFLPYFQPWYLQFLFIYLLFPRKKAEMNFTLIWLLFMVMMLSFFGLAFSPISLIDNFKRSVGL